MFSSKWFAALALLSSFTSPAISQPALDALWPNQDGLQWDFRISVQEIVTPLDFAGEASLRFAGTVETAGGTAQVLEATHDLPAKPGVGPDLDPLLGSIWRARPDLRQALETRYGKTGKAGLNWWPLLLHGGSFMKSPASIQMWQEEWDHPTWTYLLNDLTQGATFTHQLIPEIADDVFLHGTVDAIDATVETVSGTFEHAVRMRYVIDYGWSTAVNDAGDEVGQFRGETRGHVHYVPNIGPVELLEDFVPFVEIDCSPDVCPSELSDLFGITVQSIQLSLTRATVGVASKSWTQVKALYQ